MPDLLGLLRQDYNAYADDIRGQARKMREQRNLLGPRQRKRLRERLLGMDLSESGPLIDRMYAAAKHEIGENVPCAACRFLGEGET